MMNMNPFPDAEERKKETLPAYMDFKTKHFSPPAECSRFFISPVSGSQFASSASSGPIVSFNISCGMPGIYMNTLETAFVFTIQNKSGQTLTLDGDGSAVISAIDLYYGSSHLSSILDYNVLSNTLSDFTSSGYHYISGTRDAPSTATFTDVGVNAAITALRTRQGVQIPNDGTYTVSIPLICPIGTLASKAIALSQLKDSLRLDIRLSGGLDWGVYGAAVTTGFNIIQPKLWLTHIRISGDVETALINSLPNRSISVGCFDVHSFNTSIGANQGSFTYQIPIKVSSLTSIFVVFRETDHLGKHNRRALTRTRNNLENYRFRIGSTLIPSSSIDCSGSGAEARMELYRALNLISESNPVTYIDNGLYIKEGANGGAMTEAQNLQGGGFCIGLNCSAFSMSEVLSDGRSTRNEHVTFDGKFLTTTSQPMVVSFFCFTEKALVIEGGNMTYSD
jgi:hypothetical protein